MNNLLMGTLVQPKVISHKEGENDAFLDIDNGLY